MPAHDLMAEAWIEVGPSCPIRYEIDSGTGRIQIIFGGGRNGGVELLLAPAALVRLVGLARQALAESNSASR